MATSNTFTGSRTVTDGPQLVLKWERISVDIPNNRSRIKLTLQLYSQYPIRFTASKSGELQGAKFTYTGGMTSTGYKTIQTREIWVGHNSDGSVRATFSAKLSLNISWGTGNVGTLYVTGSDNIDSIPRASTGSLPNFTIGDNPTVTITRHSSGFKHRMAMRTAGGAFIGEWYWTSYTSSTTPEITMNGTHRGRLYDATKNSTYVNVVLTLSTMSADKEIGRTYTNARANVSSDEKPSISGFTVWINGSRRDDDIKKYVQNYSKASSSFTPSAGTGASIISRSLVFERDSDGRGKHTVSSNAGTTPVLSLAGKWKVTASATDSRGRSNSDSLTFTVDAYSPPRITKLTADRDSEAETIVDIEAQGGHSNLGGSNPLTIELERATSTGTWTDVMTNVTGYTSATFSYSKSSTGNDIAKSQEFRLTITDSFGNKAESLRSVSSQEVVLDIHENLGVGIGKLHEQGALDVKGDIFMTGGRLNFNNINGNPLVFTSINTNGHNFMSWFTSNGFRKAYFGIPSSTADDMVMQVSNGNINLVADSLRYNSTDVASMGTNSNGTWWRFYNGLQVCITELVLHTSDFGDLQFNIANEFIDRQYAVFVSESGHAYRANRNINVISAGVGSSNSRVRLMKQNNVAWDYDNINMNVLITAIGRWK